MIGRCALCLLVSLIGAAAGRASAQNAPEAQTQLIASRACGPIAAYLAVQAQGRHASLMEFVKRSGWTFEGGVKLSGIVDAVRSVSGMKCDAVQIRQNGLSDVLLRENCVAILPVTVAGDSSPAHVIVAFPAGRNEHHLHIVDYPMEFTDVGDITDIYKWDGAAILVKSSGATISNRIVPAVSGAIAGALATVAYLRFLNSDRQSA